MVCAARLRFAHADLIPVLEYIYSRAKLPGVLKAVKSTKDIKSNGHFAIIASEYNAQYVDSMLRAARKILKTAGVAKVRVIRVPGAYEIPVIAGRLAREDGGAPPLSAIICLGVVIRGQTEHAQLIGEAVTQALMQIQVQSGIPVVHEVLLLENTQQAEVRCLDPKHNRGAEAAQTALAMAEVINNLSKSRHRDV